MNAIQILERVYMYMDTTRNARFSFLDYNKAINDAILKFVDDKFGDIQGKNEYGFELLQQIRDDLYTLIKTSSPAVTTLTPVTNDYYTSIVNHVNDPVDYYEFVSLQTLISGKTTYVRPTTYAELLPLLEDSFKHPTNKEPYYVDDSTGYQIYRGDSGTLTSATITYIKVPATYSCGNESQLINTGGTLAIGTDYIAIETSVNAATTFQPGTQFTAAGVTLTSGQVILASNTTTCDLPDKVHNEIAKTAASILSGTVSDYQRSGFTEKEAKQS